MSIKNFDVSFRYIGIPTQLGTVSGVCLSYQLKEGAESFFNYVYEHLSSPALLPRTFFDVKATQTSDKLFQLIVQVGFGDTLRRVEIKGVDPKYITELKESLKIFKYYLFLAGYVTKDGCFVLLPIANHHMLVNSIEVDNIQYSGNSNCSLKWDEFIQSKYVISVE